MNTNAKALIAVSGFFVLMLLANPAHAYLDPGTGSMLIQALIAVVAAGVVSIGMFWRRIRSFFRRFWGHGKSE